MSESRPLSVVVRPSGPAFLREFFAAARKTLEQVPEVTTAETNDGLLVEGLWEPDIERALDALKTANPKGISCSKQNIHFIEKDRVLEPILLLAITVPEDYLGHVMGDINRRRGVVMGAEDTRDGGRVLKVKAPLSQLIGYGAALKSLSNAQATVSAELAGYEEVPRFSPDDPNGPKAQAMRA